MVGHIYYDHICKNCGAHYIPYDKNVPCPKCHKLEKETYDYISRATRLLLLNIECYGTYISPIWRVSIFGDRIFFIITNIITNFKSSKNSNFEVFAKNELSKIKWKENDKDESYLEKHIYDIAIKFYEKIKDKI